MTTKEKSGYEVMQQYLDKNRIYCFEMEQGIRSLNQICAELGYKEEGFRYGSSFEQFIQDNPGCCEKIIEWITEQLDHDSEWKESLSFEDEPEEEEK